MTSDVSALAYAVLMPGFSGTSVPTWLADKVVRGLGSVCLFAQNVSPQLTELTDDLHRLNPDLLVTSDEEGGEVTRLEARTASSWPGHAALGQVDEPAHTRQVAAGIAAMAASAGIDVILSPCADVNSDPDNPVIGLRSFGADPSLVARHTRAFCEGVGEVGIAACAKHFPGHGDTQADSHLALPRIDVRLDQLTARDLPPFTAAIAAGVPMIMTAHIVVPALGEQPATLNDKALRLLRAELGFGGVIATDAIDMRAIADGVGRARGAVLALIAGADLVCIGNPAFPHGYDACAVLDDIHAAIIEAVDQGELPLARLQDAAARVRALGVQCRQSREVRRPGSAHTAHVSGRVASAAVAREALVFSARSTCRGSSQLTVIDLRHGTTGAIAHRASGVIEALRERFDDLTVYGPGAVNSLPTDRQPHRAMVILVSVPHRLPEQQEALDMLRRRHPHAITVMTGLPDPRARLGTRWIQTYGDSLASGRALAAHLAS